VYEGSTPRFEEAKSIYLHMCHVTGSQERRLHALLSKCVAVGCRLLCHCRSPIHDLDRLDLHACMAVAAASGEQVRGIGIYNIDQVARVWGRGVSVSRVVGVDRGGAWLGRCVANVVNS
jgi:hypothetical protein